MDGLARLEVRPWFPFEVITLCYSSTQGASSETFKATPVSYVSAECLMLHCNMTSATSLQLGLEDLLADLRYARRRDDLGRLALIAYCEVRRWARDAGDLVLAEHASELITSSPHVSREAFLEHIDKLIHELEDARRLAARPRFDKPTSQFQARSRVG